MGGGALNLAVQSQIDTEKIHWLTFAWRFSMGSPYSVCIYKHIRNFGGFQFGNQNREGTSKWKELNPKTHHSHSQSGNL